MTTAYEAGSVPPIEVKHRLRIAREYAELEQIELADLIGVSRNTVGNAEKGRGDTRRIVINAWALACGVPVSWIINGGAQSPPDGGGSLLGPTGDDDGGPNPPTNGLAPVIKLHPMSPAEFEFLPLTG